MHFLLVFLQGCAIHRDHRTCERISVIDGLEQVASARCDRDIKPFSQERFACLSYAGLQEGVELVW